MVQRVVRLKAHHVIGFSFMSSSRRVSRLSPSRQRHAVESLQQMHSLSQRRAFECPGVSRSTVRYSSVKPDLDASVIEHLAGLRARHRDWGYRKLTRLLQNEGFICTESRSENTIMQNVVPVHVALLLSPLRGRLDGALDGQASHARPDSSTTDMSPPELNP